MTNENRRGSAGPRPPPAASPRLAVYYGLLVTQALSLIGSQISQYAVGIWVFRQTGHATPLALVMCLQVAPWVLFGGLAGALADRFDRRTVMLAANVGFTLTAGLLLASFVSGAFQLWHLYVLSFASSLCAAFERPAFQASIALLVPDSQRDRANAIGQISGLMPGVIAPAVGGLLYAVIGVIGTIVIDIATFIVALGVLAAIRIPRPPATEAGRGAQAPVWRQPFDGFRYLAAHPVLLGFCGYVSAVNFFANTAMVLLTPYVLARTGSARMLALDLALMNAGGIVGALAVSARGRFRSRMSVVVLAILAAGACLGLAGLARDALTIGAALFVMALALAFSDAPFWSLLQAKVAPDLQGRVFAAYLQMALLATPLAFLIGGPLADHVLEPARTTPGLRSIAPLIGAGPGAGMGLLFAAAGVLILTLSLAAWTVPAIRRLETDLPDHAGETS